MFKRRTIMDDFNEYVKNGGSGYGNGGADDKQKNLFEYVSSIASRFDGKNQGELISAIYKEAKKNKQNGTLSNDEIDAFSKTLSPFLDEKKKKIFDKIISDLKKI